MARLLTVKRSAYFVAFLALAIVGMALVGGVPTARSQYQDSTVLYNDDIAYVETNTTYNAAYPGTYDGSQVSFSLASAGATTSTVESGPAVDGVDYQSYSSTIVNDLSAGAASGTYVTVNTSGYSLPLQYDTYLPATVSAVWNGSNLTADTYWSGTVLAHAGFSTDNLNIDMASSSVSFGYDSSQQLDGGGGGGGGGCTNCDQQLEMNATSFAFDDIYLMPLAFRRTAATTDKKYNVSAKKWSAGETSFKSGKVKKWKSDIPNTKDLDEVGVSIDTSNVQFDAVSGTLNVKQKIRVKKVKKAKKADDSTAI